MLGPQPNHAGAVSQPLILGDAAAAERISMTSGHGGGLRDGGYQQLPAHLSIHVAKRTTHGSDGRGLWCPPRQCAAGSLNYAKRVMGSIHEGVFRLLRKDNRTAQGLWLFVREQRLNRPSLNMPYRRPLSVASTSCSCSCSGSSFPTLCLSCPAIPKTALVECSYLLLIPGPALARSSAQSCSTAS